MEGAIGMEAKVESVFSVMERVGLTTLEIFQNKKDNTFLLRGMKEWDKSTKWNRYAVDFTSEDILTFDYRAVGTAALLTSFRDLGLKDYLERIEQLLKEGKHHGIEFYYNQEKNVRVMYCKHDNTLGIGNKKHALRTGGIRRHELDEPEIDVLVDGLNLARAMSYKNAIANIPYGGSKVLVQCNEMKLDDDDESLGFLAYVIDRTRSFTGPDMGFSPEFADVLREKFTKNIGCGARTFMGPSGTPTAYGIYLAIKEACDFIYGSSLISKRIAIQGLGAVGFPLAEYLVMDGARLIVTDVNFPLVHRLQEKWGMDSVKYVEPEDIYSVDADIFSPCAMGGIITEERIKDFKFNIITGAANNQLRAVSKEDEIELAKKLADAGILFVIDWACNTGGVIAGWAEHVFEKEASFEKIKPRIELVCRDNISKLLHETRRTGKTPTELAYESVENAVYNIGTKFSESI